MISLQNGKIKVMYILNVIPLIKIPYPNSQLLSYFCAEKTKIGCLVKIPVRKKKINAIVVDCKKLEQEKMRLKKFADFQIKPIEKIVSDEPILTEKQIKLLFWISDYYFTPPGLVARIFLSKKFEIQNSKFKIQNLILTPKTKSLVFAPFAGLKSITVDDESSNLYKSWGRKPYYNAKNIAIELAKIHKAKLILKSGLPSIETYYWAEQKKYILKIASPELVRLGRKNSLVDMREEMKKGNFSIISHELQEKLKNSKKSILFIARRGTSTFVLCRSCGYVSMCKNCDVPMVFHEDKPSRRLVCHHCGKDDIAPVLCPRCKSIKIKYFGAGTQKTESEIKKMFPDKKVFRLDSDVSEKPLEQEKIIKEFLAAENTILVGSQMLLNKNLKADLTAIISIETILNLPDFKNSERVFQVINQLHNMSNGDFMVQTYNSDNFTIKTALENNFSKFYNEEAKNRKAFDYPPFSQIIKLGFTHKSPQVAGDEAKILITKLKQQKKHLAINDEQLAIIGPVPAFVPREKESYHWNIILKSRISDLNLRNRLLIIVPSRWEIEVDPESLL
jgi:primosomal protein N' (replication factor Y)